MKHYINIKVDSKLYKRYKARMTRKGMGGKIATELGDVADRHMDRAMKSKRGA